MQEPTDHNSEKESVGFKDSLKPYFRNWKWFILSVIVCIGFAYVYGRYATPQYAAETKIQIIDDKSSGSELDIFSELEFISNSKNKVEDELQIINSRSNFIEVVKELGLNTQVIAIGNIKSTELYEDPPITLNLLAADSVINKANFQFFVELGSNTTFGFAQNEDSPMKVNAYGRPLETPIGNIVITPNLESFQRFKDVKLKVVISPVAAVAQKYKKNIIVTNPGEFSNIVRIYLEDPVKKKAIDILDALVKIYNKNAIKDKQIIADRTASFINERIADISSNLTSVDQSAEDFKTEKGVTDIASEANINLNVGVANRQELANARTQLNIAASMKDIIEQQDDFEVLPSNIGLSDPTINSTTARYNELALERDRLLKSSNEKNPVIVNLNQQLQALRQNMLSSINGTVNNLGMQVSTLSGQQAIFNSKIYSAPKKERALRDITRQQQTTESLYLYLLQKREEAQIAVASTAPKSKVLDKAYNPSPNPVSPKKQLIYLASILLGLIIPFSIIYLHDLLDNKVVNMQSLERTSKNVPVLGELPRLSKSDHKVIYNEDRSVLAEALRIIRTNLDFLIRTKTAASSESKKNIIFVTSSIPGEGKSFFSTNLAVTFSSTDKKVLLVGADIRNPKLSSFFLELGIDVRKAQTRKKEFGLTEYIYDNNISLEEIITPTKIHNNTIDIIYSGRIPPNPAELLLSSRIKELFDIASDRYDYVIVDTSPMMVVTDTLLIADHADHIIYVTRAGVTDSDAIKYPLKLQKEGKLSGLAFIVNDVKDAHLGYGGKYGYGYGKSQKKWWNI